MTDTITREEALVKSLNHYFTGVPCANGHVDRRRTKTGHCLGCTRAAVRKHVAENRDAVLIQSRKRESLNRDKRNAQKAEAGKRYRQRHPERVAAAHKNWRARNRERIKEIMREYYIANGQKQRDDQNKRRRENPDKFKATNLAWRIKYPERAKAHSRASKNNRRARDKLVDNKLKAADIERLFAESDGSCKACGQTKTLQVDHVIAIANGGSNEFTNLQLLCSSCNQSKGKKDFQSWLHERSIKSHETLL